MFQVVGLGRVRIASGIAVFRLFGIRHCCVFTLAFYCRSFGALRIGLSAGFPAQFLAQVCLPVLTLALCV